MVAGYRLRGGSAAPPLLPPGLSLPTTEPGLLKAPSSDPQAEVATGAKRTLPPPPAAATAGPPMLSQVFPAGTGFLPRQECAPRMSILISPAL